MVCRLLPLMSHIIFKAVRDSPQLIRAGSASDRCMTPRSRLVVVIPRACAWGSENCYARTRGRLNPRFIPQRNQVLLDV